MCAAPVSSWVRTDILKYYADHGHDMSDELEDSDDEDRGNIEDDDFEE